jgi:hypothetical protein
MNRWVGIELVTFIWIVLCTSLLLYRAQKFRRDVLISIGRFLPEDSTSVYVYIYKCVCVSYLQRRRCWLLWCSYIGCCDGTLDGDLDGVCDGSCDGAFDGRCDGSLNVAFDGRCDGSWDGNASGVLDGF